MIEPNIVKGDNSLIFPIFIRGVTSLEEDNWLVLSYLTTSEIIRWEGHNKRGNTVLSLKDFNKYQSKMGVHYSKSIYWICIDIFVYYEGDI